MSLIRSITAIVVTIAEAHLLNAIGVGTLEVHLRIKVSRAGRAHAQECWHKDIGAGIASKLIRVIGAIADSVAATRHRNACPIQTFEGIVVAMSRALLRRLFRLLTPTVCKQTQHTQAMT